jgi:hypothetical protein
MTCMMGHRTVIFILSLNTLLTTAMVLAHKRRQ